MTERSRTPEKREWDIYYVLAVAILAMLVALVAVVLASTHADTVRALPGDDQAATATVQELQRANDHLLEAIWAILGVATTLVILTVGINLFRGDRIIERERVVVERGFSSKLTESAGNTRRELTSQFDEKLQGLNQTFIERTGNIPDLLEQERRERAALEYQILELQQQTFQARQNLHRLEHNDLLPYVEVRIHGWQAHTHQFLSAAARSGRPELVQQVLETLDKVIGPGGVHPQSGLFYEAIRETLRTLPERYDPLRIDLLSRIGPVNDWEVMMAPDPNE